MTTQPFPSNPLHSIRVGTEHEFNDVQHMLMPFFNALQSKGYAADFWITQATHYAQMIVLMCLRDAVAHDEPVDTVHVIQRARQPMHEVLHDMQADGNAAGVIVAQSVGRLPRLTRSVIQATALHVLASWRNAMTGDSREVHGLGGHQVGADLVHA